MATPSTADLSESFAHLTLDNTDKLSTTDEISVHSLPDLHAFLELARQHDKHIVSDGLSHRHEFENAVISNHLTPLLKNESLKHENLFWGSTPGAPQMQKQVINNMDGAALFKALQPFIDQYMSQRAGQTQSAEHNDDGHENYLDLDLKVEDTFDNIRRHSIESNRPSSPLTSPPQSSESHFTDSRGTFVDEDVCRPIPHFTSGRQTDAKQTATHSGPHAHEINIEQHREFQTPENEIQTDAEAPQVDLPDLTTDEIDLGQHNNQANENTIAQLRLELEQYKQDNAGLINELQFLRKQHKDTIDTGTPAITAAETKFKMENRGAQTANETERPAKVEDEVAVDMESIPEEFRPYYQRLQLAKVDTLTSVEKSNLIKSIMLSLLVSDFDHLPLAMPQVGSYLRMTSKFLDDLHSRLYRNNEVGPLRYLRDYNLNTSDGLQECLDGMLDILI